MVCVHAPAIPNAAPMSTLATASGKRRFPYHRDSALIASACEDVEHLQWGELNGAVAQ
ncbi:hypothetical protein [Corynebacterium silvaticum]|uniref:hypothetical protein n=1 Tax=Corynebacterium silvaticum TaxID=2320431 RepID=UPI0021F1C012|nr:hypothetical protein [Corynebacterium silvaticum]